MSVSALARRIARRFAMEHSSPEALKDYLKEHPQADKSKHTVKGEGDEKSKKKDDDEGGGDFGAGVKRLKELTPPGEDRRVIDTILEHDKPKSVSEFDDAMDAEGIEDPQRSRILDALKQSLKGAKPKKATAIGLDAALTWLDREGGDHEPG